MGNTVIVGAGLAGLIAAVKLPHASVVEAKSMIDTVEQGHRALLRFRSDAISNLTGMPFKKVTVTKAIATAKGDLLNECSLYHANLYAQKVSGTVSGRSITNLEPSTRWIAPPNFHHDLIKKLGDRVSFNHALCGLLPENTYVSTAPLKVNLAMCEIDAPETIIDAHPIKVTRYRLPDWVDVYQTVYFPEHLRGTYRASITGRTLIVESVMEEVDLAGQRRTLTNARTEIESMEIMRIMGIRCVPIFLDTCIQKQGKLVTLEEPIRHALIYRMSTEHNLYSLGRFATWRNVLLDDVLKDVDRIERLMSNTAYGRHLSVNGDK